MLINQITYEDFGLLKTEVLKVDFISLNLNKLTDSLILRLANYFQNLVLSEKSRYG
jgi:hypothetical protein